MSDVCCRTVVHTSIDDSALCETICPGRESSGSRAASALARRARAVAAAAARLAYIGSDFGAMLERDPALHAATSLGRARAFAEALTYAGFWAILVHRLAHVLRALGLPIVPRLLQAAARFATGVDIHPGALIGRGLFIDHAMGTVIGETAELGEGVTLLHQVTLGGRGGPGSGKRHPTLGDGVFVGAGAKILGPVRVGSRARIGANAVVLEEVPAGATAVGIPARIVRLSALQPEGSSAASAS
jgi:serine O-acetyltransferase